ncbi:uncharacterized protein N7483_012067 [Penicillium malachiteum]|uniref:uncharacterized protein n=1 Tax=Penicillium malachiteum TaxID=1324776 RepID=UPI0025494628|nr:uncharacterized protein N7483_012067 [Penicillium malachiteum]KAJ5714886.1 hypothetical protein N7483_012067 [Penicillium malachiteum]
MSSSLNFTTRQLDVKLNLHGFQINLDDLQKSIKSALEIMSSSDSLALHLNEPLEAQTSLEILKVDLFEGRDPRVEESSGTGSRSPPSMVTWMQLIQEVPADAFTRDSSSNVLYSCLYKGKIVKVLEKEKQKIKTLQQVFIRELRAPPSPQDIRKEEEVTTNLLSSVNNTTQILQGEFPFESTRARRRRPRQIEVHVSDERNSIPSPRRRLPSIEVSTEENCIPRSAEELARGDMILAAARDAGTLWPAVANEYAEIFRVRRSPNSLSRFLNIYRASLRHEHQPQVQVTSRSEIRVSTNRNSIPLRPREKREGGPFVESALRVGNDWDTVCDDYSVEFGVWRYKWVLGLLRNRYLRAIASSEWDGTSFGSSQVIPDVPSANVLIGVSREVANSEEETHWVEMQEDEEEEADNWVDVQEEDTPMADISIRHSV